MVHESCLWYRLSLSTWFFALSEALALQSLRFIAYAFLRDRRPRALGDYTGIYDIYACILTYCCIR